MISRRNIRVKVMQTIYAVETQEVPLPADPSTSTIPGTLSPEQLSIHAEKLLLKHFEQTRHLLVYMIHILTQVALFAETHARQKASKHLPTAEDLTISTKIASNELIEKILHLPAWKEALRTVKPELITENEITRKLFLELKDKEPYQNYITAPTRVYAEEKSIVDFLLKEVLLTHEWFLTHLSELFPNWDDDADMILLLITNFLQKLNGYDFSELISKEKKQFGILLLKTALEKKEVTLDYIRPRLKNWDPERIATLDMILMRMGVCEFLFFETIPPKVTINEYIDIAKEYSTPQSGHFVNGILDNIHKDLVKENKMHKIAYKQG
jgi:N utilization substance protein B